MVAPPLPRTIVPIPRPKPPVPGATITPAGGGIPDMLLTPGEVKTQEDYYNELLGGAVDSSPTDIWGGIGRMGKALIAGYGGGVARENERKGRASANQAMADMLASGATPSNADLISYMTNQPWANEGMGGKLAAALLEANIKAEAPTELSPGAQLIQGGKVIAENPNTSGQSIYNYVGGEGDKEFQKKVAEIDAKTWGGMVDEGQAAQEMQGNINRLAELGSMIKGGTGIVADWKQQYGPYAEAFGINIEGMEPIQAYKALTAKMAQSMRTPGSGPASDTDVRMFLDSIPNLRNTPGGNQLISETMTAVAQWKMQRAEIADRAMHGEIDRKTANQQIRALGDPWSRWLKYKADKKKFEG